MDRQKQATWTNVPPVLSGTQIEGTSLLPLGLYEMPNGNREVSFGLPQPLLDSYRSFQMGTGQAQDPAAPPGYVHQNTISKGAQGAAGAAMLGGLGAGAALGPGAGSAVGSGPLVKGFFDSLQNSIGSAVRRSRDRSLERHRMRQQEAEKLRAGPESFTPNADSNMMETDPSRVIEYYAARGMGLQQLADRVGMAPADLARIVQMTKVVTDGPDRELNSRTKQGFKSLTRQASEVLGNVKRGDLSGRRADDIQRQIDRDNAPPVTQDEPPMQITDGSDDAPPAILPPKDPAPPKSKRMTKEQRSKIVEKIKGMVSEGGDVPSRSSALEALRKLPEAEGLSDGQLWNVGKSVRGLIEGDDFTTDQKLKIIENAVKTKKLSIAASLPSEDDE